MEGNDRTEPLPRRSILRICNVSRRCTRIDFAAELLTPWLGHEMMLYMKVTDVHWFAFRIPASLNSSSTVKTTESLRTTWPWDSGTSLCESLINVIQTTSGNCGEENALQEQRDCCYQHWQSAGFARTVCENTTLRAPCGLPSFVLSNSLENNAQPCEVSEKISIFSCRWKSAPEAMTDCQMRFVMLFGGKTRLYVCSSCCGIDREVTKSTTRESNRLCSESFIPGVGTFTSL